MPCRSFQLPLAACGAVTASLIAVTPAGAQAGMSPPVATASALGVSVPMQAGPPAAGDGTRLAVVPGGSVRIQHDASGAWTDAWTPTPSPWHAWVTRSSAPRVPVPGGDPLAVTPVAAGSYDVTLPATLTFGVDRLAFATPDRVDAVAIVPLVRVVWVKASTSKVTARLAIGGAATVGARWRRGQFHSERTVVQQAAPGMATLVLRPSPRTRRALGGRWADRSSVVVDATAPAGGAMTETVRLRPR